MKKSLLSSLYIGIYILLLFIFSPAAAQIIVSDNTWKTSAAGAPGWQNIGFNDAAWTFATAPTPFGCTPVVAGSQPIWSGVKLPTVFFRKTFTLAGNPSSANVVMTADDNFDLFVNGVLVGSNGGWSQFFPYDIKPYLKCGENVIAVRAHNVIACAQLTFRADIQAGKSCCFAASNPLFQPVPALINSTTVLSGKYFVPSNTTVNVTGAGTVLDLTNVDIVFGECAGITFSNGARVRAHNSVFRTCDESEVWRGFEFQSSNDNVIEECIFKNAIHGLAMFRSNGRVTNNQFHNNRIGVLTSNTIFTEAISGNTFVWNQVKGNYKTSCTPSYPVSFSNDFYGIYSLFTTHRGLISQNDFINGIKAVNKRFGIKLQNSGANISANKFSNMHISLELVSVNSATHIENNQVEIIRDVPQPSQVNLLNCYAPVLFFNNKLTNSNSSTGLYTALYADQCFNVKIKQNSFKGFRMAIHFNEVNSSSVIENHIEDCSMYGILDYKGRSNDIACNDIDLNFGGNHSVNTIGIATYFTIGDRIHSNCIKNCFNSIYTHGNPNTPMPYIRNNYLYNYRRAGIYNTGHTGSIGTSASDPGMNTLYSNHNLALDIVSAPMISAANNFGMFNISGVMITQNNPIHSIAACGHQVYSQPSQGSLASFNLLCDESPLQGIATLTRDKEFVLDSDFETMLARRKDNMGADQLLIIQNALPADHAQRFNSAVNRAGWLNESEKSWLNYYFALKNQDYDAAQEALQRVQASGSEAAALKYAEEVKVQLLSGKMEATGVEKTVKEKLSAMAQAEGKNAVAAGNVLGLLGSDREYRFAEAPEAKFDEVEKVSQLNLSKAFIEVYPNPVADQLSVKLYTGGNGDSRLEIVDVLGKVTRSATVYVTAGTFDVNVSDLSSGVYIMTVTNREGLVQKARFVKR